MNTYNYKRLKRLENIKTVSPKSCRGRAQEVGISNNRNLTGKILVFWIGGHTWKLDKRFLLSAHGDSPVTSRKLSKWR